MSLGSRRETWAVRAHSKRSLRAHLRREGIPVAKSTVERLMRRHGWQGVRRQKSVRTTIADPAAERAPDVADRQFRVPTPNALVVADFTSADRTV